MLPPLVVFLAGCAGIVTSEERLARREVQSVGNVYHGKGSPLVSPLLETQSPLRDLLLFSLLRNPRAEAAFHEWRAAVEEITIARSLPDPMLTFGLEISRGIEALTPALMTDPMNSWPGPGKLPLRAEAAYRRALAKRAVFERELLAGAFAVKQSYYQLWVVDEQLRWTRDALTVVEEMERLARERLAVGKVTQQDVLRAQMERDKIRNDLVNLEDSRRPMIARLRSALGLGADESLPAIQARLGEEPAALTEEGLLEQAFVRNPRLREMRAEVEQAGALFQLARRSTVPDLAFGVGANLMANPVPIMPSAGITLPIWRDKIAAEIAAGRAGVDARRASLSAEMLDLTVRFAEATFFWREADRNVRLYSERLLPKAKAALESAQAGYVGGLSGFLDLLEAERTLLDFQLAHATARGQRVIVLSQISLVIMGRWPEGVDDFLSPASLDSPRPGPASRPQQRR